MKLWQKYKKDRDGTKIIQHIRDETVDLINKIGDEFWNREVVIYAKKEHITRWGYEKILHLWGEKDELVNPLWKAVVEMDDYLLSKITKPNPEGRS